jgi:hypothetical protein
LNGGDVFADLLHRGVELRLTASGDEEISALGNEPTVWRKRLRPSSACSTDTTSARSSSEWEDKQSGGYADEECVALSHRDKAARQGALILGLRAPCDFVFRKEVAEVKARNANLSGKRGRFRGAGHAIW